MALKCEICGRPREVRFGIAMLCPTNHGLHLRARPRSDREIDVEILRGGILVVEDDRRSVLEMADRLLEFARKEDLDLAGRPVFAREGDLWMTLRFARGALETVNLLSATTLDDALRETRIKRGAW